LRLPGETKIYVPRLLALAHIVQHRNKYAITLPVINDQPYLGQVDVGRPIKLTDVAKMAGMSLVQLKQLNPAYSKITTDPHGSHHKLLLPLEKIEDFKITWERVKSSANTVVLVQNTVKKTHIIREQVKANKPMRHYAIRKGDTLGKISKRFGVAVNDIKRWNSVKNVKHLKPGQSLVIHKAV
jgi:membrane-bound lytic murein transglycosylase D